MEPEREPAALPRFAPDLDRAAQETCVFEGDREAQPGAAARAGRIGLVEALEQMRQVLGRDPGARVGDLDEGAVSVPGDAYGDAVAAVIERVSDEVGDDSLEPPRVTLDHDLLC